MWWTNIEETKKEKVEATWWANAEEVKKEEAKKAEKISNLGNYNTGCITTKAKADKYGYDAIEN